LIDYPASHTAIALLGVPPAKGGAAGSDLPSIRPLTIQFDKHECALLMCSVVS